MLFYTVNSIKKAVTEFRSERLGRYLMLGDESLASARGHDS